MAEKIVKVCDRCQTETILFNTASWETVTFHKLQLGKPEGESVKYDLCGKCAPMVKVYCFGAETRPEAAANSVPKNSEGEGS